MKELQKPFPQNDIEFRLQSTGKTSKGLWGKCLAYVTNRAIQARLDDVFGCFGWKNEYKEGPNGGIICGISIKNGDEWVTKWDGAENTNIEAVKGGLSDSMKRCAVQWGIGRYLYNLDEGWAQISPNGMFNGVHIDKKTKQKEYFKWNPPQLPKWALPPQKETNTFGDDKPQQPQTPPVDYKQEILKKIGVIGSELGWEKIDYQKFVAENIPLFESNKNDPEKIDIKAIGEKTLTEILNKMKELRK